MVLALALLCAVMNVKGQGNEFDIKAMFIYNFTRYAEWPVQLEDSVFRIGVLGRSEIITPLEQIAAQKRVKDKKIEIVRLSPGEEQQCHLIFIPGNQLSKLEMLEKKFAGKGVLIVTDESDRPSPINLVTRDNKIRFEINQSRVKNGGVKLSSQLLSLAAEVHP